MPLASIIQAHAQVVNINHLDFHGKLDFSPKRETVLFGPCVYRDGQALSGYEKQGT